MAKKDKKKDKRAGRGDAVRSAVDQAFQATAEQAETARGRALRRSSTSSRRPPAACARCSRTCGPPSGDEINDLRETVEKLEQRVAALEAEQAKPKRATTRASAASRARDEARATKPRTPAHREVLMGEGRVRSPPTSSSR